MSPRTGRPKAENPKKIILTIRLSEQEANDIKKCAEKYETSRTGAILMGIKKLLEQKK